MSLKRGLRNLLVSQGYDNLQKRVGISLIILITGLIAFSGYFLFFYATPVANSQEFANAMTSCKSASWMRNDSQANWLYTITGREGKEACKIEVELLKIQEGTIDLEGLEGKKMICISQKGETQFPEKDIFSCTGELKEELQNIIIQRMHNYLLQNVGQIKSEFETL